ncbi:MAG: ABC transporter substrate-binding protein [bacterium]|nr:ABC transporter substrate-binding protein [bacterium]
MKQFLSSFSNKLNSRYSFPLEGRFTLALKSFTNRENQIFFTAMGVLVGTTIVLLIAVNNIYIVKVPATGGTLVEGVINTPAHINPLLATSEVGTEADRDISSLVYSGLLRRNAENGFIPDLAESYSVSKDGLVYTFVLKPKLEWHDGKKITADDIVFTIKTAQDGRMKSPKRANWDGVLVEKVDELTVRFTLKKPYAPFLENATMGILPEHVWKTIDYNRFDTNKYNREPIGSGPYKFDGLETTTKDGDEIPISYTLKSFGSFALGEPYIDTIKFVFFRSEEALAQAVRTGSIGAINSISPQNAKKLAEDGFRIEHTPLPRVLAVFFNQDEQAFFSDPSVRKALTLAVDKQAIIDSALAGYGVPLDSPLPPGTSGYESVDDTYTRAEALVSARKLLEKADWKFSSTTNSWTKKVKKETQTLRFDLATSEAVELKTVANELKDAWAELGVGVKVTVYATGDLKETIVRPRKFDALFFGQVIGLGGDPYAFWHSSQRLDPNLNIASYANTKVDKILDSARTEIDPEKRVKLYQSFNNEIKKDAPAIFMYAPEFLYVLPKDVQGVSISAITTPSERFLNVWTWYIDTDNVWKIFARTK